MMPGRKKKILKTPRLPIPPALRPEQVHKTPKIYDRKREKLETKKTLEEDLLQI